MTPVRTAWRRRGSALGASGAALLLVGISGQVVAQQAIAALGAQPPAAPAPTLPLSSDQVATHLGETVDWYHHLVAIRQRQLPEQASVRDRLHQQALTAVELALEVGKACAVLLNAQSQQVGAAAPTTSKGFAGRLDQAAANIDQRINTLQSQLDALSGQSARAHGKNRETLFAQKAQVSAALSLAHEVRQSVQDMKNFEASSIAGDNANLSPIEGQIADIERTVPELRASTSVSRGAHAGGSAGAIASSQSAGGSPARPGASSGGGSGGGSSGFGGGSSGSPSSAAAARPSSSNQLRVESAGLIALVSEWLALTDMRRQLNAAVKETDALQKEIGNVRASLVHEVSRVVGKDFAISDSTDPAELLAQGAALEADSSRFKQLSTVLVPLGEQALALESAASTLGDWRTVLDTRMATAARYLALRLAIVLGWTAVVLGISEIWRRARPTDAQGTARCPRARLTVKAGLYRCGGVEVLGYLTGMSTQNRQSS